MSQLSAEENWSDLSLKWIFQQLFSAKTCLEAKFLKQYKAQKLINLKLFIAKTVKDKINLIYCITPCIKFKGRNEKKFMSPKCRIFFNV